MLQQRSRSGPFIVAANCRYQPAALPPLQLPPLQHDLLWDYLERAAHSLLNTFED